MRFHTNSRMSGIVIANRTVYLSGQVPSDLDADIQAQTQSVLEKIHVLLAEAGSSRSLLLTATIYLKDMSDFEAMNRAWEAWLPPGAAPARTTVQAATAKAHCKVEITVQAFVGDDEGIESH